MPKPERGTPKDIANRMKAKGLQKLKFYCQMCSKQCRDENGFKCHMTSDSHLRQMKIFAENASGIMDEFSSEFERSYLETLRRRHGTKRMNANNVYQEVIQDKHHVHMNSTKWATLGDFVQYLGRAGKCEVEDTERGWYVKYIERDPALLARREAQQARVEAERAQERREMKRMEMQRVEAARALDRAGGTVRVEATALDKEGATVALKIGGPAKRKKKGSEVDAVAGKKSVFDENEEEDTDDGEKGADLVTKRVHLDSAGAKIGNGNVLKRKRWGPKEGEGGTATEAPPENVSCLLDATGRSGRSTGESAHGKQSKKGRHREHDEKDCDDVRKEYWLYRDIVVRIISSKLAKGKYYKRKAIVDKVVDKFTAEVEVLDSGPDKRDGGDIIRLDQDDLETVIPKVGKTVRILNGRGRCRRAEVVSLDKDRYRAVLKLKDDGRVIKNVSYEDFSKVA